MNIETRKLNVIKKITLLKDDNILSEIENILKSSDWWDELPTEVKKSIDEGIEQAKKGETMSHEDVIKEAREKYGLKK